MTPPRYNLRWMLTLLTSAAIALGYCRHRSSQIRAQCDLFLAEGVSLTLPQAWRDDIWQRLPATAVIDLDRFRDYVALDEYTYYRVRVRELEMRLQNFGVTEVKRQSDYVQPTLPEWAKSGPLSRLRRSGNHVF